MEVCFQPSVPVAIAASSALCTIFVACLYLCTGKVLPNRDDPAVVKERFVRVGIASALAPVVMLACGMLPPWRDETCAPQAPLPRWIGLWSPALPLAFVSGLGLTMLLFLGPLVMAWLDSGQRLSLRGLVTGSQLAADLRDPRARLLVVRNLLVGPLAEEWVFRACMCPLLFGAGLSDAGNVFLSAVIFGAVRSRAQQRRPTPDPRSPRLPSTPVASLREQSPPLSPTLARFTQAHLHHRFDSNVNWLAVAVQARRSTRARPPRPPCPRPPCPFPAATPAVWLYLLARCVAVCAVHLHFALRRLLVLPLPAHRASRGAARGVRRRARVATAAATWRTPRSGPRSARAAQPLHPPPGEPRTHPGKRSAGRHVFCNFMGLPDFGGVPSHPHARLVGTMFVVGLGGFIAAVSLDAVHRPALFGSLFWTETR